MCQGEWVDSAGVKAFFEQVSTQWDDMRSSFYNADDAGNSGTGPEGNSRGNPVMSHGHYGRTGS